MGVWTWQTDTRAAVVAEAAALVASRVAGLLALTPYVVNTMHGAFVSGLLTLDEQGDYLPVTLMMQNNGKLGQIVRVRRCVRHGVFAAGRA